MMIKERGLIFTQFVEQIMILDSLQDFHSSLGVVMEIQPKNLKDLTF